MTEPATDELGRILVIIPTYEEAENIGMIVDRVRRAVPEAHILVAIVTGRRTRSAGGEADVPAPAGPAPAVERVS